MSDARNGNRVWIAVAVAFAVAATVFLVLWRVERPSGDDGRRVAPRADVRAGPMPGSMPAPAPALDPTPVPAPSPAPAPPVRPPHVGRDPYGFDWDPFGDDWEGLFEWPELPGGPHGEQLEELQQRMRADMERMRDEMRQMREQFRGRMAPRVPGRTPPPGGFAAPPLPPPPGAPALPDDAPDGDDRARTGAETITAGVEVSRLDLPDAVVFVLRGRELVEGSLTVKLEDARIVLSGEARDPDGVTRRFSRSFQLDGPVAADRVDVRPLDGGYRVVLPRP